MADCRPSTLVITLGDLAKSYEPLGDPHLSCAGCGTKNPRVSIWVLPGLCNECAFRVVSVTPFDVLQYVGGLLVSLSEQPQDSYDPYSDRGLSCASCHKENPEVKEWVLPGLCKVCAPGVALVTVAAPRPQQASMFDKSPLPA